MWKTCSHCLVPKEWLWHVYTCDYNDITRWTLSGIISSGNDFHLSRHMTNWNLIWWFLDLNILVAFKFAWFNLHDKASLSLVSDTSTGWAFNLRSEFLGIDYLIDFTATNITSINSNLNARFYITCSSHNTLDCNQTSDLIWLNISHPSNWFLCIRSINNKNLVSSFKFRW